jgi:hypothetical protein
MAIWVGVVRCESVVERVNGKLFFLSRVSVVNSDLTKTHVIALPVTLYVVIGNIVWTHRHFPSIRHRHW